MALQGGSLTSVSTVWYSVAAKHGDSPPDVCTLSANFFLAHDSHVCT